MAVAYDIKAHPTVYGARQFRSRLEAKWASFFDLCGWQFEYEPFDLEGWSPDFLLGGNVLVEVKPITQPDDDTINKMRDGARACGWNGELLLLGVSPLFDKPSVLAGCSMGWLGEYWEASTEPGSVRTWCFALAPACLASGGQPDFMHADGAYSGRMSGERYKTCDFPHGSSWLKATWDRAANRVQWHKK